MGRSTAILPSVACLLLSSGSALAQCPIERLLPPLEQDYGDFGEHVIISGQHVLVADDAAATLCPIVFDCATGAVYHFRFIDDHWERVQRILPPDVQQSDRFGTSMDLDGDRLIVGSHNADLAGPETGGAYIYDFDGEQWAETARIPSPNPRAFAQFGRQVIIEAGVAFVQQGGTLYVYQETGPGQWTLQDELTSPDGAGGYFGGHDNVLTEEWLFVGMPYDESVAVNAGSVYVFRREGPVDFAFHQKLDAPHPEEGPRFGSSIATDSEQLFVGAVNADDAFEAQGAIFRFELEGGLWVLRQEIQHASPGRSDRLGYSLALHGNTLIAGATGAERTTPISAGVAFVFTRGADSDWVERTRLRPAVDSGPFGVSVGIDGQRVVVGSSSEVVEGAPLGAAHVFDLSCEICRPDLDTDGELTIFDFLTFLNLFEDGEAAADFDGDGELTIFDFLAFQTAFDAGC